MINTNLSAIVFCLLALSILFIACEEDVPTTQPIDQTNNPIDTNSTSINQLNTPLAIGNFWDYYYNYESAVYNDYVYDSSGYWPTLLIDSFAQELRQEITKDSIINNNTYFVLENIPGSFKDFIRYENGSYYRLKQNLDNGEFTEWKFFDEYAQVGDEWLSDTINLQQFDKTKFIKTNVTTFHTTYEVDGIEYDNVTELEIKTGRSLYEYPYGIGYCGIKKEFYAAGIGLIKSTFDQCVPQGVSYTYSSLSIYNYNIQ